MKITRKGRHKLFGPDGKLISEHTDTDEAYEKADAHAQTLPAGVHTYRIVPAEKEYEVSTLSRIVYDTDTTRPSAPVLGSVATLSTSSLRITWTGSTDTGGSGLAGYRVKRSTTSGGTYTQVGSDLSTASLSYDDTGLSASTTYYYRVFAFDGAGNESLASNTGFGTTSAVSGLSAPGVSGTIANGNRITITAQGSENFGSTGPGVLLFDDFENGTHGDTISLTAPYIGAWSTFNDANRPRYDSTLANTGTQCMFTKAASENPARTVILDMSPRSEFFMSFWRRYSVAPTGISIGQCKETWLLDGAGANTSTRYDMCWPTRTSLGGTSVAIAGNDFNLSGTFPNAWYANEWSRFAAWGKSNGSSPMNFYVQGVNATAGVQSRSAPNIGSTFFGSTSSTTFSRWNVPGYYSEVGWSAYWDNVYFASTPARVEVRNGTSLTVGCTRIHIVPTPSDSMWTATQVQADLRCPVVAGDTIMVYDRNNNLITERVVS